MYASNVTFYAWSLLVVTLSVMLYNHQVACDDLGYDPTDPKSIMLAQLKVQEQQLKVLDKQLEINLLLKQHHDNYIMKAVAMSVASAFGSWIALQGIKYLVRRLRSQSPRMPQPTENNLALIDFPLDHVTTNVDVDDQLNPDIDRSKSPTEFFSGRSSPV